MGDLSHLGVTIDISGGRVYDEVSAIDNYAFMVDRERVVHSAAFRRLEYKTQVFVNHVGDHYRTRLTHSIEVAQIARKIARKLGLNEDLADTIALSHDLGHPPFGHAGEEGLNEAANLHGGFDHNAHTLRILVKLEKFKRAHTGLNLLRATLDGIAKHNGCLMHNHKVHPRLIEIVKDLGISVSTKPSLEAQIASLADDIAYINHDIDDGLRASMFEIEELWDYNGLAKRLEHLGFDVISHFDHSFRTGFISSFSGFLIGDLIDQTLANVKAIGVQCFEDVQGCKTDVVAFSPEVETIKNDIKEFLMRKVYRNYRVNRMTLKAKKVISELYKVLITKPDCLPQHWQNRIKQDYSIAEIIIDYIAGMTDRFALEEHRRLLDPHYF